MKENTTAWYEEEFDERFGHTFAFPSNVIVPDDVQVFMRNKNEQITYSGKRLPNDYLLDFIQKVAKQEKEAGRKEMLEECVRSGADKIKKYIFYSHNSPEDEEKWSNGAKAILAMLKSKLSNPKQR